MARAVYRVRLHEHFAHIGERAPGCVPDLKQLLGVAELSQQVRDIGDQLRIAEAYLFGIVAADQFSKQLLQRMRFRNHWAPFVKRPTPVGLH
jgi:hypothetical protein